MKKIKIEIESNFNYKDVVNFCGKKELSFYIVVGFLIRKEELRLNLNFNMFWKEFAIALKRVAHTSCSRSVLYESKCLYINFKRYTKIIDNTLSSRDISIPSKLSKHHLLLILRYCPNEHQQDIFIEKVVSQSLTVSQLKDQLLLSFSNKIDVK